MFKRLLANRKIKYALIGLSYVFVFLLGMYAYKNDYVRGKFQAIKKPFEFSYSKYQKGLDAEPEVLDLSITDKSMRLLTAYRDSAVNKGYLHTSFKKEVKATLYWRGDSIPAKVRLKGDFEDHWSGDKWSMRINIKGDHTLLGMDKFSIQDPKTRLFMNEWYYHQHLNFAQVLGLRYQFIRVKINGESKGVFAIEESFSKELLENSNRKVSPILKFQESEWIKQIHYKDRVLASETDYFYSAPITVFGSKKVLQDAIKHKQFLKGRALLDSFRNGSKTVAETFDLARTAKLFALAELTGTYHGMRWHNQRFYYNPVLGRLEMIGFDSGSGEKISATRHDLWKFGKATPYHGFMGWQELFFSDKEFVEAYFDAMYHLSKPSYLPNFNKSIKKKQDQQIAILYSEDSYYEFDTTVYYANSAIMRSSVEAYRNNSKTISIIEPIRFELGIDSLGNATLAASNTTAYEINLHSIKHTKNSLLIDLTALQSIPKKLWNQPMTRTLSHFIVEDTLIHDFFDATYRNSSDFLFRNAIITYRIGFSELLHSSPLIQVNKTLMDEPFIESN